MKMVKSLLLGSAAGLVAVAGAQAADLPVKAKPVQYVKICSLYGAGFYYIPGTDMCLKVGGWVRMEAAMHANGASTTTQIGDVNSRATNELWWRHRGYITADARNQTEYGTVRAYIAVGLSTNSTAFAGDNALNQFDANRAMIQWAGFTFGRTTSFYDFYVAPAASFMGYHPSSDVGDGGIGVMMYTAQFGNGFSGSIGVEMRRVTGIFAQGSTTAAVNTAGLSSNWSASGNTVVGFGAYGGYQVPDIVGNLRVDQAWGSAQIMGAMHLVNGTYYTEGAGISTEAGHPSDKWGFAAGAGLRLNAPMIGPGDYFQAQVNYTNGALKYLLANPSSGPWTLRRGTNIAYGVVADAVYGGGTGTANASALELTTAWGFNASYEHFWNMKWRTSLYGGYTKVDYNTNANNMLCWSENNATATTAASSGTASTAIAGCNNDWSTWWLGSRTQWNVTPDFYLGLDVMYLRLHSGTTSTGTLNSVGVGAGLLSTAVSGALNTANATISDQGNWTVRFRAHKDFYP
jgi:hypothetical protein